MAKRAKKKVAKPKPKSESITRTQPFSAHIRFIDGKNRLQVDSQTWYQHNLNKFKDGDQVTLELHTRKPKRSDQQNRYYWGIYLPLIAAETGENDLEALHELFKGKFMSDGIVEILGNKVRKKRSTTDLGVGEFCEYIMNIEALTEVAAPPTENYDLAPLRDTTDYHGKQQSSGD